MDKQRSVYSLLYKRFEYMDISIPDYKITGYKIIKNKKILIVGIGTARDTKFLFKDNDVWGVDYSKEALKYLKKYDVNLINANLNKPLRIAEDKFDIIVAKDIFEHIENPLELLKILVKKLKKNGYIVINVPNHFYLPMRLRILFGKNLIWKSIGHDHTKLFNEWDYMHKIFFTWWGFKDFLSESGLCITRNFWDIGTLNHYSEPDALSIYFSEISQSNSRYKSISRVFNISIFLMNLVFPKSLRSRFVSISPSLLSASFYVWCKKKN